jgi:hypothetical protein
MAIYWITGIVLIVLNSIWLKRIPNMFGAAAVNAFITCTVLVILQFVLDGELSNLWPFSYVMFGIPLFIAAIIVELIAKRVRRPRL